MTKVCRVCGRRLPLFELVADQCACGLSETAPSQAHRCEELHKDIVDTWGDIHAASVEMGRSY